MKKTLKHLIYIAALALCAGCLREVVPVAPGTEPQLSVRPSVAGSETPVTKVEDTDPGILKNDLVDAWDELRENFFGSLDIFVKRQADAPGTAWFKEYHLNAGDAGVVVDPSKYDSESLLDQAKQLLASNWAEQGYVTGEPYDIYVTANNPHTAAGAAPANLTGLQALTTNDPQIFRYYLNYTPPVTDNMYYSNCMYSEKKNFLMDGKIEGWTIDPSKSEQVFDVDLERAAAKIIVTVKFSDEKNIIMQPEPTAANPNPEPVKDEHGKAVYGSIKEYMALVGRTAGEPRWKPVNFCYTGSDIAYDTDPLPANEPLMTSGSNYTIFKEGTSSDNTENTFAMVTYTYPIDWSADNDRIPYVLLSVFYTRDSDGDQLRSYYRIPVCDESTVTSLDRNHIYIVDVELASLGASNEAFDAQDEELRIEYHVIPWTETNMTQEATTVKISDTKYLTIIPTEYTLKGDGTESVDLQWYASVSIDDGRIVDIDPSTLNVSYVNYLGNTTDIKGTVTKQVRNDSGTLVTATDANTDGKRDIVITSTAPTTGAQGEKVIITLTPTGILRVESEALASRAVKDISFVAYLKNATGVDAVPITIRHFPLDNIQSFTGVWSSKWDETYTTETVREYSFNPEADGWGSASSFSYEDNIECSLSEYNYAYTGKSSNTSQVQPSDPDASSYRVNYTTGTNNSTVQTQYRNNVAQGSTRMNNDGESNAILGADGYWYWGDTQTTVNSGTNYDWRGNNGNSTTGQRYRWTNYHRSQYSQKTTYYARRYYRDVQKQVASTGSWVDWEKHTGTTTYDNIGFYAKVYANNVSNPIDSGGSTYHTDNSFSNLTNPQMYVIQLTSTSNTYAIGRPVLDGNYQSQDNVCSPAFMIASQLGAVSGGAYTAATAAEHCGTYMEVDKDGNRYTGWRLPTKSEIETIIKYQTEGAASYGVTMVRVLAGRYYWALDGNSYQAYASGTNNTFTRCVRDLTYEEIKRLNKEND